ncbi:NUDIX domain-containing protein [Candidatus Uhrbacteria bacterium]|nr:NUDIX domain-containing protein [Candidatus Uhrbacteria bacterium]
MKPVQEMQISVAICERNGKILLIQRKDLKNKQWDKRWEFPGGKIEPFEKPEDTVIREVFEETGLSVLHTTFFLLHQHDWDLEEKILRVHLHCFHCYVGQGDVILEPEKAYSSVWTTFAEVVHYEILSANKDILNYFITCNAIEHGSNSVNEL